jgi:DNA repair ATPase RecN
MNEAKRAAIETCDKLTTTRHEFAKAVLKSTGTTLQGIKIDPEILEIWMSKEK